MSTTSVTVRSLGYSDLPQVIAIERRSFPTPWSIAMFVLELSKPSGICLAALHEQRLVGYLICAHYPEAWHLMNVAVDPPARGRGVATAMLEQMIRRAGLEESYTLEVRPSNRTAIALYERFGFRSAGTRRRYYRDTGEDAVIMWRVPAESASRSGTSPP
jgi:[ribosomal protein S18]-alanine N-acetyltransferase